MDLAAIALAVMTELDKAGLWSCGRDGGEYPRPLHHPRRPGGSDGRSGCRSACSTLARCDGHRRSESRANRRTGMKFLRKGDVVQ